jgi:hypothetical protein
LRIVSRPGSRESGDKKFPGTCALACLREMTVLPLRLLQPWPGKAAQLPREPTFSGSANRGRKGLENQKCALLNAHFLGVSRANRRRFPTGSRSQILCHCNRYQKDRERNCLDHQGAIYCFRTLLAPPVGPSPLFPRPLSEPDLHRTHN